MSDRKQALSFQTSVSLWDSFAYRCFAKRSSITTVKTLPATVKRLIPLKFSYIILSSILNTSTITAFSTPLTFKHKSLIFKYNTIKLCSHLIKKKFFWWKNCPYHYFKIIKKSRFSFLFFLQLKYNNKKYFFVFM